MKKRSLTVKKPKIELSITVFENLLTLAFSEFMNRPFFKKLKIFFESVDTTLYTLDVDVAPRYLLLERFLDAIIDNQLTDIELIHSYIIDNSKDIEESDIDDILDTVLVDITISDANNIENSMIDRINFFKAEPKLHKLKSLLSEWEKGSYASYSEIISSLQTASLDFTKEIYSRSKSNAIIDYLDFGDNSFKEKLSVIHREITNEKRLIKTGIKRLNKILGGGLSPGRVYLFLGVTGGWKSGLLLNIIFWAMKYNKHISCRDNSKKPAYVYITQENDLYETVERTCSYIGATNKTFSVDKSFENVYSKLKNELETEFGTIIFIYRKKNQLTTTDIDNLLTDIESEGVYEVKLLVHDYLKRLLPAISRNDLRIDLGEAANELSNIAKERRIPIVTANQLNREAYKLIEAGTMNEYLNKKKDSSTSEKKDLGRGMNLSMQSESSQISENVDSIFAVVREYSELLDQEFLGWSDLKQRGAKGKRTKKSTYFAHPFERDNSMRLMEDTDTEYEYSIDSISDRISNFNSPSTEDYEEDCLTIDEVFGN